MLAACLVLACALPGAASAALLLEEHTFDHGLSGWQAAEESDAQVQWDGLNGSPRPGSLLMSVPVNAPNGSRYKAVSQCRALSGRAMHSVRYRVRPDLGTRSGRCFAVPVYYPEPGCQGEGSISGTGDVLPQEVWTEQVKTATSFSDTMSMRVEFVMRLDGGTGPASCHLDSVEFWQGIPALRVPTLVPAAMALFALLLAAFGATRLRGS